MQSISPFSSSKELFAAYLAMLDGLCSTYLAISQAQSPEAFEGRGVVIPESQVTVALSGQLDIEPHEGFSVHLKLLQARAEISEPFPLLRLFEKLEATDFQQLVILLALAPEFNRKYERIFAYLQDNINEKKATLGLAADLYSIIAPLPDNELYALYNSRHPINRYVLLPYSERAAASGLSRVLSLRQTALLTLTGTAPLSEPLPAACTVLSAENTIDPMTGYGHLDQAARFVNHFLKEPQPEVGLLQLYGAPGTGHRFTLQHIASQLKTDVLCINCETLSTMTSEHKRALMETAISYCFLTGSIPAALHFDFPKLSEGDRSTLARWILRELRAAGPVLALCGEQALNIQYDFSFETLQMHLQRPNIGEQKRFWDAFSAKRQLPLSPGTDTMGISNLYSLTPGQIEEVLAIAEMECVSHALPYITEDAISHAVRQLCSPRLAELTQPLPTHFTWEDLQLSKEPQELLRRLVDRIRYRYQVKENWGFDKKLPYGKGISVLLYGPPGTGKTMAAQVLAREFGLDAYRVDMSRILDKYIGETEKKLAELFDAAKDSNAILFFDEADALFSKRTEVTDAKDKYANVETAYLLQRIEAHNGISILATNIAQNFDEAFKRRISFMVHLPMPNAETRRQLWHSVFPSEAPLRGTVDLDFFAQQFELSGSSIKSIAVSAAYLAAADGTEITRNCIVRAIKEEYAKTGRVLMEHELY